MPSIYTEDVWQLEIPGSRYTGWPTLTKTNSGELMAVYSGGRQHHVELSAGYFLSLWYDKLNSDQAYLRLARWRLD